MYGIEVLTPAAGEVVPAADLRAWLRLYDSAEDGILAELVAAAVDLFESDTGAPVLATTYRQHLSRWPFGAVATAPPAVGTGWGYEPAVWSAVRELCPGQVVLMRGNVSAVAGVYRALSDGSAEAVPGYSADLRTNPARVSLAAVPAPVLTAAGVPVSPVGYVEYTAGWADADAVPKAVRTAIKLLAAHWYKNREAYAEKNLTELPQGWCRVVNRYRTGLSGDWGQ